MDNENQTLTPEQLKEKAAAEAAAKAKAKAEAAAKRAAEKEEKAKARAAEKQAKKEAREAEIAAKKQAKIDAKKAQVEAKESAKQPMQNDVRRPKPETTCGKIWAVYDRLTNERGSPCAIADAKPELQAAGVNDATIRTQYAHWRKYYGVTGRVEKVAAPTTEPTAS